MDCGALPPVSAGTCEVTTAGTTGILIQGDVLAPDTTYRGGGVLVDGSGTITCVGCDCDAAAGADAATVVSCPDAAVSPGLINTHDHITYANNPPHQFTDERYEHRHDWRTGTGGHTTIPYNGGASGDVMRGAELRFMMGGATSTVSAGGTGGLLRNLDSSSLSGSLGNQAADSDTFPLGDANGTKLESGCGYPNITTNSSISGLDAYVPHVSEGIDTAARNEFLCIQDGANDLIEPQTGLVHAVGLTAGDINVMEPEYTKVVWSPRSNISLYGNTASVSVIERAGVPMALGTDWLPSGSANLLRELACAIELNEQHFDGFFSDVQLWRMVTTNAAFVAGVQLSTGMLKEGLAGDIAVFRSGDLDAHSAVVRAQPEDVALVARGGQVLYGDDALLASQGLGTDACETLDVCGAPKRACVAMDVSNSDLATVQAATDAVYPLVLCGVPADEPTCVPYRRVRRRHPPTTSTVMASPTPTTTAPRFNPLRPMDSIQPDEDADGAGDAATPAPSTPATHARTSTPTTWTRTGSPTASTTAPSTPTAGRPTRTATARVTPATTARTRTRATRRAPRPSRPFATPPIPPTRRQAPPSR